MCASACEVGIIERSFQIQELTCIIKLGTTTCDMMPETNYHMDRQGFLFSLQYC